MLKITNDQYLLYLGDCLEDMNYIPDASVDMILCDLPYGTTACKWDTVIPFEGLWAQWERLIKPTGAIVLFGSQPFTSLVVSSNPAWFRYEWVWHKHRPTGFLMAKHRPLKAHENILVFSQAPATSIKGKSSMRYNPQGLVECKRVVKHNQLHRTTTSGGNIGESSTGEYTGYPWSVVSFNKITSNAVHPTQKPVDLCEYLIRTYTNEGEIVLDNCMGSGTTGVACANSGRRFIGVEKDQNYFDIASQRISEAYNKHIDSFTSAA